jgi:hypothetical protein
VTITVGRVTALAWPGQEALAAALAHAAERPAPFPGLGELPPRPITLLLARTRARFDSVTDGRLPRWSNGAAFPDAGAVVILSDGPSGRLAVVLRHELAHLALRWHAPRGVPLWFDEGYAAVAAGEWTRYEALGLNWTVARGVRMTLDDLDRALRSSAPDAGSAYALATTAVRLLERWGGARGLAPLLAQVPAASSFDQALRATYHVTEEDFETRWQADLRRRYGWLSWASAAGLFWGVAGALALWLVRHRRRRERLRRAALEGGAAVALDDAPTP